MWCAVVCNPPSYLGVRSYRTTKGRRPVTAQKTLQGHPEKLDVGPT